MFGMSINTGGVNFNFDASLTAYKLIASIEIHKLISYDNRGEWVNTGVNVPDNYNYLILFSRGACYLNYSGTWDGKTYKLPSPCEVYHELDQNRNILVRSFDGAWKSLLAHQMVWIIIYPVSPLKGNYGIQINGRDEKLSLITEANLFTKVLWKGDVYISPDGLAASDINPAFNSRMLSFFYWENENITMGQVIDDNRGTAQWEFSGKYYAYNSKGYRTGLKAKMVVFGEKPVTKNNYGFEIYNRTGELVYSIADEVFREPEIVIPTELKIDTVVNLNRIKRPMINPCSIGGFLYPFRFKGDVCRDYFDVSFANTGKSLIVRRSFRDDVIRGRHNAGCFFTSTPFPVFDASNYFEFGD